MAIRAPHPPSPSSACITCLQTAAPSSMCFVLRTAPFRMRGAGPLTISQHPVCVSCEDQSTTFEPADEATLYRDRLSVSVTDELAPPPPSQAIYARPGTQHNKRTQNWLRILSLCLPHCGCIPADQVLEWSVKHPRIRHRLTGSRWSRPVRPPPSFHGDAGCGKPTTARRSVLIAAPTPPSALLRRIVWVAAPRTRCGRSWHDHCVTCAKIA